jgi:hypothetical protein
VAANISADAPLLCQPLAAEHARFDRERRRDLCQGSNAELGERLTYCLLHGFGGRLRGGQFDVRHYRSMPVLLRNRCIRVQTDADGPGLLLPSLRQGLETHHGRRHAGHDRSVHGGSPRRWQRPLPRIPVESDRLRFRTAHARASAHSRPRRNIHIEGRAPGRCGPSHADWSARTPHTEGGSDDRACDRRVSRQASPGAASSLGWEAYALSQKGSSVTGLRGGDDNAREPAEQ